MILITGGLGFIGLHTARAVLDMGEDVVLTQYRVARAPDFIKDEFGKRAFIEQLDITDGERMKEIGNAHKITGIIHLAVPGLAALSAAEDYRVNMFGLLNVLEAGEAWGVERISLGSSVTVYAGVKEGPFEEEMPLRMTSSNPTEAFKKAFEVLGNHYAQRTGMNVLMLRIAGIYGPLYHSMANLPSRLVHAALKGEAPPMRGEFAEDGGDLCYVKDTAQGIALAHLTKDLRYTCYNVGAGRETKNRELVAAVQTQAPGFEAELKDGNGPTARPKSYLDITRIREDTGYEPKFSTEAAIADYVGWLRAGNEE
jgi:UDP-glucose 4-epimerase